MPLTVIENAYLRLAEQHPGFSEVHKKIILFLLQEKKHFTKEELLCFASHSYELLEEALQALEKGNLVRTEGWLVKLIDEEVFQQKLLEENALAGAGAKVLVESRKAGKRR